MESIMPTRSYLAASALLLAALGCRDEMESPMAPSAGSPEATVRAAAAMAFRQVSSGWLYSCGVTTDDRAYCWGLNNVGQLGTGTFTGPETCEWGLGCSTRPVAVVGGLRFRSVSVGEEHACALTTDGLAYCWGSSGSGQLGNGTKSGPETCDLNRPCSTRPVAVAGGRRFRQISAGDYHNCAVNPSDRIFCWGSNGSGQLGDGTTTDRLTPARVQARGMLFRGVSTGGAHTCAVTTTDRAYCWGANSHGQLGNRSKEPSPLPGPVYGGLVFRGLDAGWSRTCAVTTDNRAYCWGSSLIGDGTTRSPRLKPVAVAGGLSFSRVSAGDSHACGLTTANHAYCWGPNGSGEIGDGTLDPRLSPAKVVGEILFSQVSAGAEVTCGVSQSAVAYCWGQNRWGQLGDGTKVDRVTPTGVVGPT